MDYLKEGEGIFCGRINRFETLQVAFSELYSVIEEQNQSEDELYILHIQGQCLLGQMPFLIASLQSSKYLPLSYSDNAKEHSPSHEGRGV